MKKILLLNKKEGQTPLEALEDFRAKHKKYKNIKMTYAGRLDPMASGLLLILLGEETKNKEKYLGFDKEYEFEILFGFSTDTYDILGKVKNSTILPAGNAFSIALAGGTNIRIAPQRQDLWGKKELEESIKNNLKAFTGKFIQEYPAYSSKTVNGKPLFQYARDGEEVKSQKREVLIKSLKLINIKTINSKKLLANIEKRIKKVKGDFRQEEILRIWRKHLDDSGNYFLARFRVTCTSGMYVRSLSDSLGKKLGTPALAYSIKRTKIGKFAKIRK